MPIFKNFIVEAITKKDTIPFKVPKGIIMMVVDPITGLKSKIKTKKTIYESYKIKNLNEFSNKNYYSNFIFDNFNKKQKKINKFYQYMDKIEFYSKIDEIKKINSNIQEYL